MTTKSLSEVENALEYIMADTRDVCIKVGMGLKNEFGEEAYSLWDSWLSTGKNYNQYDMFRAWKSFKSNGAISLGSIFYLAKQNGFKFPTRRSSHVS